MTWLLDATDQIRQQNLEDKKQPKRTMVRCTTMVRIMCYLLCMGVAVNTLDVDQQANDLPTGETGLRISSGQTQIEPVVSQSQYIGPSLARVSYTNHFS